MKKKIIYGILIMILIIPIIIISVVAIVNQPGYITETIVYDNSYDENDMLEVVRTNFYEEVSCSGYFDSSKYSEIEGRIYNYQDSMIYVSEGDYVENDTLLFTIGSNEYNSEVKGKVIKVQQSSEKIIIKIQNCEVDRVLVNIPVSYYPTVNKSSIIFDYANQEYNLVYSNHNELANDSNFTAYYKVEEGNFILGGKIDLYLRTGVVRENVIAVPKECIYSSGDSYFIYLYDGSDNALRLEVELGLQNRQYVEIISSEDTLMEGSLLIKNDENIFNKSGKKSDAN